MFDITFNIRNVVFVIMLLYPFKGLVSVGVYVVSGLDLSAVVVPFLQLLVVFSFVYLMYRNDHISSIQLIFLFVSFIGIVLGFARHDMVFVNISLILFVLPVIASRLVVFVSAEHQKYTHYVMVFVVIYALVEYLVVSFYLPAGSDLNKYYTLLTSNLVSDVSNETGKNFTIAIDGDEQNYSGAYRSRGFVGNLLVYPVFVSMSAVYFFVLSFEYRKISYLVLAVVGFINVLFTASGSALFSYLIVSLMYLFFTKRFYYLFMGIPMLGIIIVYFGLSYFEYSIYRLTTNILYNDYLSYFFWVDLNLTSVIYLIVGSWSSSSGVASSHLDLYSIIFGFGVPIVMLLWVYHKNTLKFSLSVFSTPTTRAYAYVFMVWLMMFIHHQSSLTINPSFLAYILFSMMYSEYKIRVSR